MFKQCLLPLQYWLFAANQWGLQSLESYDILWVQNVSVFFSFFLKGYNKVQAKNSYILFASTLNGRSTTLSQTSTETVSESRQWENLWQERQGWAHTGFTGRFDVAFERNMAGLLYPTTFHKVINWTPYKAVPLHKAGPLTPTSPRSSSQLRF